MIDIERRIFIDKNTFSISYSRFCVEINNYTVNIYYINAKNENKTFSKRFRSFEECFAAAEQLREHQGTLEEFEKDLGKHFTRVMKKDLFDLHKIAFEDNFERPSYLSSDFVYNDGEIELLEEEKKCDEKCDTCSCSVIAEDCCPYDENEIREKHEKESYSC